MFAAVPTIGFRPDPTQLACVVNKTDWLTSTFPFECLRLAAAGGESEKANSWSLAGLHLVHQRQSRLGSPFG
jgi:hypothetical protein